MDTTCLHSTARRHCQFAAKSVTKTITIHSWHRTSISISFWHQNFNMSSTSKVCTTQSGTWSRFLMGHDRNMFCAKFATQRDVASEIKAWPCMAHPVVRIETAETNASMLEAIVKHSFWWMISWVLQARHNYSDEKWAESLENSRDDIPKKHKIWNIQNENPPLPKMSAWSWLVGENKQAKVLRHCLPRIWVSRDQAFRTFFFESHSFVWNGTAWHMARDHVYMAPIPKNK